MNESRTAIINCPSCGRPINDHTALPAPPAYEGCRLTPNDIAWTLLFGEKRPAPEKPARRPMGAWE